MTDYEEDYEANIGDYLFGNASLFERPIKHFSQVINVTLHHFYITGEIEEEVDRYIGLLHILKTAETHDKIYIYINSSGGFINTAIQICAAIKSSPAEVITVMEGEVCSAATFIFLSGHRYIVNENCSFMIHNYSHGAYGKGAEVAKYVKFYEKYYRELARNFYKDFLTTDEIKSVCEDTDIWMNSSQVLKRLEQREAGEESDIEEVIEELTVDEDFDDVPTPRKKAKAKAKAKPTPKPKKKPKKKVKPKIIKSSRGRRA